MRDSHPVVVEPRHNQRRAHPGILRTALRRIEDGQIGRFHFIDDMRLDDSRIVQPARQNSGGIDDPGNILGQARRRQAAGHFAGVVAPHAIGQDGHAKTGVGVDGIFVVRTDHARIGTHHDFQGVGQPH